MNCQNSVSIKTYAKKAKERLTSGYWDKIRKERDEYIRNNSNENVQDILDLYSRRLMREIYSSDTNTYDAELYKKVCKLLSNNEFTLNPIGQLIDHSEYDSLDYTAKQNYILKLTDKYNEMRERYEREKDLKIIHSF